MKKGSLLLIATLLVLAQFWIHHPKQNQAKGSLPENNEANNVISERIIVSYQQNVSTLSHAQVLADVKLASQVVKKREELLPNMEVWELKQGEKMEDVIAALGQHPAVAVVEPDFEVHLLGGSRKKKPEPEVAPAIPFKTDDPIVGPDPKMKEDYGLYKIHAPEAWSVFRGSSKVVVAIIDSGVDYTHEDLFTNLWYNPGETGTYTDEKGVEKNKQNDGIDNDGNGFPDDVIGWDMRNNDAFPFDDNNHGTHVAGTVGAVGQNGRGISGVTQDVSLMAVKFTNAEGSGSISNAIKAIRYAVDNGAKILSNSWGDEKFSQNLYDAVKYAEDHGVLFVAAAGNGGGDSRGDNIDRDPTYPAAFDLDNVVAVAATGESDKLEYFSNYGSRGVDLGAPGAYVYSTVRRNKYDWFSGTSMATPHVSGAAALVWGFNENLTYLEVKNALIQTVDPIKSLAGKSVSGGRVNVKAALDAVRQEVVASNNN